MCDSASSECVRIFNYKNRLRNRFGGGSQPKFIGPHATSSWRSDSPDHGRRFPLSSSRRRGLGRGGPSISPRAVLQADVPSTGVRDPCVPLFRFKVGARLQIIAR